jgi:hypothetical protein
MARRDVDVQDGAILEALEGRVLFAQAPFASVGLAYESGSNGQIYTTLYGTEGTVDTLSGDAQGTTFGAGNFDRFVSGPLLFDSIQQLDSGRYLRHPDRGTQGAPEESNGARFLTREGFGAGWWFADFGDGEQEVEFIVERPSDAVRADFQGTWRFASISNDAPNDDFSNAFGEIVITSTRVNWYVDGGYHPSSDSSIVSTTAGGLLRTNAGHYMYLNADKSVMIFIDMAEGDEETFIGVAVREDPAPYAPDLVGEYLLAWAFADGPADFGPNSEVLYAQRYLRLEADGDYRIWDLDDYDSGRTGDSWVINRGEWFMDGGEVVLEEFTTGDLARFIVADNGSNMLGFLLQEGDFDDPVVGLATRAFEGFPVEVEPFPVFTVQGEGAGGRQLVYQLGEDDVWEVTDLGLEAGGPATTGSVVTWVDPKDGHAYAAGMSAQGVILYSEPDVGDWYARNLSNEAFGQSITSGLQVMTAPDGVVHLTGLNASGQLVHYFQLTELEPTPEGWFRWGFVNVHTNDLVPQGLATPAYEGALTSYATSWGGLNVAGLDANGRIWTVWWSPGQTRWTVTDLSMASGAGPIYGNLAVYLTPWNGINLAGLDESGDLQVTWWVPSLGGVWNRNNLTEETGGPRFLAGSVTSYVSEWGGLNVAGMDEGTGEIKVYWWVPERTGQGWAVTSISASIPLDAPIIEYEDIRGLAGPDSSLNIFGYGGDGSLLSYYWYPQFGGDWRAENLSELATDR